MAQPMIVKVQVSVAGNRGPSVLIYDEVRHIQWEGPCDHDPFAQAVRALMAGRVKAFFHAHMNGKRQLVLSEEAPQQDW